MDNKAHYDGVTDAWKYILGDNLHYGYFDSSDIPLEKATNALIEKLAALAKLNDCSSVLDVGCGTGTPAFYLYEKFGCSIAGISISPRGVEIAEEKCRAKQYSGKIKFYVKDALDNGFAENSFDIVWVMESSHLMRNKIKLFEENYRVLKKNGCMLLCDLILINEFSVLDIYKYQKELATLEKSFGKAKMETLEFYKTKMLKQGFQDIEVIDISNKAFPTLAKWKDNTRSNKDNILKFFSENDFNNFLLSCDIISDFFSNDTNIDHGNKSIHRSRDCLILLRCFGFMLSPNNEYCSEPRRPHGVLSYMIFVTVRPCFPKSLFIADGVQIHK